MKDKISKERSSLVKNVKGKRIDLGGKPIPPESVIPPTAVPEPPPPTPDRVRATPKNVKGQK